jgi:hypothetical protein
MVRPAEALTGWIAFFGTPIVMRARKTREGDRLARVGLLRASSETLKHSDARRKRRAA